MESDGPTPVDTGLLYEWGSEELTREHQKRYVGHFARAPGVVLEIGCGRGTMLSLLQEAGIKAYGVDASPEAVRLCRERGIEAFAGNGAEYLASLPDAFLGGIFGAHVIEHMEPREAMRFLGESHRVLKPGSALVLVTPNPADLRTTERFWLDITHVRPYPRKLLVALLERQGFHGIRCTEDREPARNALERIAKTIARVWFLGLIFRGDLVVVARR